MSTYDQKVASLIGEEITGDWNLVITDFYGGILVKWVVEIEACGDGVVTYPEECDSGANCNNKCKCAVGSRPDPNTPGACITNSM